MLKTWRQSHLNGIVAMKYVYLLQSYAFPGKRYVGITADLEGRVAVHNAGGSPHTAPFRPWKIVAAIRFENDGRAGDFEQYLKSGSGHAFAKRHLW